MFDEENDENGNQPDELADRIANMLRIPQPSDNNDGDAGFVNPNITLRVDPGTGTAYRVRPGQTGTLTNPPIREQTYIPPIQTRDAQGKTLPKYRMGIGQRILASVANFANGFAGNGKAPVFVGPGALNNRYYQDEAFREQQNDDNQQRNRDGNLNKLGAPPWTSPQDDGSDDATNDVTQPPPPGAQVGPGPAKSRARQRFGLIRKSRSRNP